MAKRKLKIPRKILRIQGAKEGAQIIADTRSAGEQGRTGNRVACSDRRGNRGGRRARCRAQRRRGCLETGRAEGRAEPRHPGRGRGKRGGGCSGCDRGCCPRHAPRPCGTKGPVDETAAAASTLMSKGRVRRHRSARSRVAREAGLEALKVLLKRHPRAALDVAAAAAVKAGRVSIQTLTERLRPDEPSAPKVRHLTRAEIRQFLKALSRSDVQLSL